MPDEVPDKQPLTRKQHVFNIVQWGFVAVLCIAIITGIVTFFIYDGKATDQEGALQKQYPVEQVHLSDYLHELGLPYQVSVPVTIGRPIASPEGALEGGGFQILGTGRTSVKGDIHAEEYFPIQAQIGSKVYPLMVHYTHVTGDFAATTATLSFSDPVLTTYQRYADCSVVTWRHPTRTRCSVTPASNRFYPDTMNELRKLGMAGILAKYATGVTAPPNVIPN